MNGARVQCSCRKQTSFPTQGAVVQEETARVDDSDGDISAKFEIQGQQHHKSQAPTHVEARQSKSNGVHWADDDVAATTCRWKASKRRRSPSDGRDGREVGGGAGMEKAMPDCEREKAVIAGDSKTRQGSKVRKKWQGRENQCRMAAAAVRGLPESIQGHAKGNGSVFQVQGLVLGQDWVGKRPSAKTIQERLLIPDGGGESLELVIAGGSGRENDHVQRLSVKWFLHQCPEYLARAPDVRHAETWQVARQQSWQHSGLLDETMLVLTLCCA
ncbi:hypothetical protein AC579_8590 [Pseudocercospora musae]|uniref:Uncharacterized protein n=1 Tax=Pseudocercospora musae TaxID=113226 RepID=A0A139IB25_9PEZI|nr:hypothetical protein AC579_8590 [Pseudocercospora musae]